MSTYEKEALTIIEALKRWRHYFLGNDLIIRTDHKSLQFMTDQKLANSIQHKLMLKLLEFNFQLEYKKGKDNLVADALSRKHACMAISMVTPTWISAVEESYKQDSHCQQLLEQLLLSPDHTFNQNQLQDGIIRHKGKIYVGKDLPLRNRLMQALHSSAVGGHSGINASYNRLKQIFYWPAMKKDMDQFVTICPVCQKNKGETCPYPGFLDPLHIPDMVWTHVSMDFIEGLPKSEGKEVIFVVVDRLSKFAHFIPLSHPYTTQTVARAFVDNVLKLHGPPVAIVSDRDTIFTSKLWQDIFSAMGIDLRYSSSYHL